MTEAESWESFVTLTLQALQALYAGKAAMVGELKGEVIYNTVRIKVTQ